MRYSTGRKKRSRLQGHRKRRRTPEVLRRSAGRSISWTEYKTFRQFQTMGEILDEFKVYGFRAALENAAQKDNRMAGENGHNWLTEEQSG